jgi:hypothetical protein
VEEIVNLLLVRTLYIDRRTKTNMKKSGKTRKKHETEKTKQTNVPRKLNAKLLKSI